MVDLKLAQDIFAANRDKTTEELLFLLKDGSLLRYNKPDSEDLKAGQKWSNSRGIVAFRDWNVLLEILPKLI